MKMRALFLLLLAASGQAGAAQDITLRWNAASAEALPLTTYVAECKATGPGSSDARTIAGTVEADTALTVTVADGPQFCWLKACWTTDTACTSTVGLATVIGPVGPGAQAVATAGANGTITPARASTLKGSTLAFTVTPSGGYTASIGGTCPAGNLVGTAYTTGVLTQSDCTVNASFAIGGGGADVVSPTLTSFTVDAAGTLGTAAFSESVVLHGALPTLACNVGSPTLGTPSSGTASSQTWAIAPPVAPGAVCYLDYDQPGNGIEDAAGNDLASFQGRAVTNNSAASTPTTVAVTPADGSVLTRWTTSMTLSAVTDQAAECGYAALPQTPWVSLTPMSTSDDLTHTASIPVRSGKIYRHCVRCRSAATQVELPDVCGRRGVDPVPAGF